MELAYTAEVRTKSINHGYLIGAGGTSINKLKESLGVRFSFAHPKVGGVYGARVFVEGVFGGG